MYRNLSIIRLAEISARRSIFISSPRIVSHGQLYHIFLFIFYFSNFNSSALPFLLLQKPFSNGKHLTKNEWLKIFRYSLGNVLINVLWMFGLTQCGPLR